MSRSIVHPGSKRLIGSTEVAQRSQGAQMATVVMMHKRTGQRGRSVNNHGFTRYSALRISPTCSCSPTGSDSSMNAQVPVGATRHLI